MIKKSHIYHYKFNSVFIKTYIVLVIFSLIPVIGINSIIYKKSTSTIQNQSRHIHMNMLVKTTETVDLIFKQVDQIIQQLSKDSNIVNLIIDPDKDSISNNREIINELMNVSYTSNYISSVYVYTAHSNKILSSNGGIYRLDNFYDNEWLQAYKKFFLGTYRLETRKVSDALGNQFNCITLIRNIPYASWSKLGAIVVNVSEDKLYDTIAGMNTKGKGEFYVINRNGNIILHKNKDKLFTWMRNDSYIDTILRSDRGDFIQKVNGQQMFFTYVTSHYNGWKYIYTIPVEELKIDSKIVSRIIIITTLLYILLGLFLAFIISRGMYQPVEKLMNIVMNSSKAFFNYQNIDVKDEYEFLGYAYNDVIDKNRNMNQILDNIKPMVKEKLFTNLIMGKDNNLEEISEKLGFLNIDFSLTNFIVIAMQIDGYGDFRNRFDEVDRNLYKIKLISIVETIISHGYKGICVEVESDKMAAIINFTESTTLMKAKAETLVIARNIKSEVEKYFPFTITLGIGRMYKDITNIKLSYNEAVNALKYKLYQGKNEIINIDDIQVQSEELYYFDSEKEKMLINNLKVGQQKEVEFFIDELVQEILDNRNISYAYVQQVFIRLVNSIVELVINMGMTVDDVFGQGYNLYEQLLNKETIKDIKVWLSEVCAAVVKAINNVNSTKSQKNAEKILEYIHANSDQDISLNDVADWIGFSRAYVCKVFKEHIGKSYNDYLNGIRIEKAKQLLKNTQLSIKEVGFKVGFNSIQTFMRAFKKYEGITPGQYRDKVLSIDE